MVDIEKANEEALKRVLNARPVWIDVEKAIDVIPGMKKNLILHAGPAVTWDRMSGSQRGAVMGALMYEGLAKSPEEAEKLAASGEIEFDPCHHHHTVGPMAGIVSASMPVVVVENETFGNRAFNTLNEGIGKVLRMGAYSPDVIERLKWMENVMLPVLSKAIKKAGKMELKPIIAEALTMGDELHNRSRAASYLLFAKITPYLLQTIEDVKNTNDVINFMQANIHTFLPFVMASCKASLDPARNIEGSTLVTVMSRNGTDWGIQVSGLGDEWFIAESPIPDVLLFPGFKKEDVGRDIGDSSIMETAGLGGLAIAAAPAIIKFVGGNVKLAVSKNLAMYEITIGENNVYQIPYFDFRGTPTGIDIRKVVEKNLAPFIDTGVAHKDPGVGQVGAGLLDAPMEVFKKAVVAFAKKYK
ncbi:DUF1116 domain-containing protein [bacterium]|nr:DUF1116 domain-containing protein [bacterium]MBU1428766.1 DUF1116 domain-containing protein [bacterium]MCG2820949.1 DUF1116 domain-containing protein [Candidatus Atribacteria bacterium]